MFKKSLTLYNKATKLKETYSNNYYTKNKVKSWVINSYGGLEELQLQETRVPIITGPNQVLIKVHAASINPIDKYMLGGYGRTLISTQRDPGIEFPLILGRDFSGTILAKGYNVSHLKNGDEIYGFTPLYKQGSFSELVLADAGHVQKRPSNLNKLEAAALVYVCMTAWSALFLTSGYQRGTRVLILGASGGVGTVAVQMLKSQGCVVYATCATDAVSLVQSLGADYTFDYKDKDVNSAIANEGKFDVILDCAKYGIENISSDWEFARFITLNSPLLVNTDQHGLVGGLLKSSNDLIQNNLACSKQVRWGFFVPSSQGFEFVHNLIKGDKIRPVIQQQFNFDKLPAAFEALTAGHLRGKIVIDFN